jgi:hypothetical protein
MKKCKLVHEFNEERNKFGDVFQLYNYIRKFHGCLRMMTSIFDALLKKLEVHLSRLGTNYREVIFVEERLNVIVN